MIGTVPRLLWLVEAGVLLGGCLLALVAWRLRAERGLGRKRGDR